MNDNKVAILGCAKNCANYIQKSINNMISIGNMFNDYKIIIFENDSKDNTKDFLQKATQLNNKIKLITEQYIHHKFPYRTWCIAYGRQRCANYLKTCGFNPDYVIVMDMDDVGAKGDWLHAVHNIMNKREYWDAAFPRPTYDLWALRFPHHTINYIESSKTLQQLYENKPINEIQTEIRLYRKYKFELQNYINNKNNYDEHGLLNVYSSFNGLAIYKYEFFKRGTYSGKNIYFSRINDPGKKEKEECEHVNFHFSMRPARLKIVWDAYFV